MTGEGDRIVLPTERECEIVWPMTAQDLIDWRNRLRLKQEDAAILLGVSNRSITYYETGGRKIDWSKAVNCYCFEHWSELRQKIPMILEKK